MTDAFLMTFGNADVPIVFNPEIPLRIPLNPHEPVAVLNVVPVLDRLPPVVRFPIRKFGFVEFPIVFPVMVNVPAPAVLIPVIPPEVDVVFPIASKAPIVLF